MIRDLRKCAIGYKYISAKFHKYLNFELENKKVLIRHSHIIFYLKSKITQSFLPSKFNILKQQKIYIKFILFNKQSNLYNPKFKFLKRLSPKDPNHTLKVKKKSA